MCSIRSMVCFGLLVFSSLFALSAFPDAESARPAFEHVFGDAVRLDDDMRRRVLEGETGKRHYVDRNGDGSPEEVWFVDTAKRHREDMQPLLVRVLDEDGDLEYGHEPDLDSDLYVADWKGDGLIDAVCDYTDLDGDGDADEMALYFPAGGWTGSSEQIMVWWGKDIGDDNLLWYDVGYTYFQRSCQYRTHFGGDEMFSAYLIGAGDSKWLPAFENPFTFYDLDEDGVTEEVVRIEGHGDVVNTLRWSFDADNDATTARPRDFDLSISAHAPGGLEIDDEHSVRFTLRNIPTGRLLGYRGTPPFCRDVVWGKTMLTWDEDDNNIDGDRPGDTQERWEGVIGKGNEWFKQVGGPSCGPFNKRYEVDMEPKAFFRLYLSLADKRLHLFNADHMMLVVDYDRDRAADMRYQYRDNDQDGYIDMWELDTDGDGDVDDTWHAAAGGNLDVPWDWSAVNSTMQPIVEKLPAQIFALAARLREAIEKTGADEKDAVWQLLDSGFDSDNFDRDLRIKFLNSNESMRFYLGLVKDRLLVNLKQQYDDDSFWKDLGSARSLGDHPAMRHLVEKTFELTGPVPQFEDWRAEKRALYAKPRVAWGEDWVPPNIGWESDVAGYRAYWGQFDFFGKKEDKLVIPTFGDDVDYHEAQPWGMDALHVGETCGCGGITLYVNDKSYPVWSPEGTGKISWEKQLVDQIDSRVTVKLTASNVGPEDNPCTVTFHCSALAGRKYSPVTVKVMGGPDGAELDLGIGLVKLPQESFRIDTNRGVMGSWGIQEPKIGRVGLGVVFPPKLYLNYADLPDQHQVILKAATGQPVTYYIRCDWLRGRRFSRCPTLTDWFSELCAIPFD